VRNGCFCAHPLLYRLLCMSAEQVEGFRARVRGHRHDGVPGAVRASLGIYNTAREIDLLVDGLKAIAAGEVAGTYDENPVTGEFVPRGAHDRIGEVFDLEMYLPMPRAAAGHEHPHRHGVA
jgi:cysteine desulfurase / selenocysteine lyase